MNENRENYELMEKNILKESFPQHRSINSFKLKPFYLMTLEDNDGDTKQIKIYKNSDPYELAYNFCKENNLDFESMKYIKRNIKNIIKKFEEKDFYFLNNNNSIYEEEDEDNYEIGETYQNINGTGDSEGNGGTNENDSQNDKNMSNKIINSLIKNKGNKDQLKINKIPPKQTKINEQIKKVVKANSLISPNSIRNNLTNVNSNTEKSIKIKKEISAENNLFKIINNSNTNKLNEISLNTDYNSTTERNKQFDNLSKNNMQNSVESLENGVPLLKSLDNINNNEKRNVKGEDGLNIDICIKNNEKVETIIRGSNNDEEKQIENSNNKSKEKEKEKEKMNIKSSNDLNLNKSNKNDSNNENNLLNSNKLKNRMLNSKNSLNNINKKAITDSNNINYKLINLRKYKDKNNRMTRDLNNIKSYRNIEHNPQNTILFLTEYKNIINILKGFKKIAKNTKNKTSSKENNKKENTKSNSKSYITKIIRKVVNQYRNNRSYDKYKKVPNQIQAQLQMKIPNKLKKNIHHHFSPQKKLNKFIEFNISKKSSKDNNNVNFHFFENTKSYKNMNINHNQLAQLEKEKVSPEVNYQNLSNTCRNNPKKIKENKSFNESRFYKKNKIKSKMLNKNMNAKAYNQKFKNNKNKLKKKNFTISNTQKIMEEKFIHYGSCNFRPLSKDFINGYLEGLKSKFSALIYSPLKEEKNLNNIIFNSQKSNIMFYEQKAQKNNMIQKCISNLKDNLAENKTRTHAKKEIILYNNNNSRRNFKVNHSTLNAFNKTINYKSLHNSKEKLRNSSNDFLNKSKANSLDNLSDIFKKIFFYLKNEKKKEMNISKNFYSEKLKIFPKEIRKILNKMINYLISNYTGKTIDKNNFINEMGNIYSTVLSKNEKNIFLNNKSEIFQVIKQKKFQSSGRHKSIYHFDVGLVSPLSLNNIKSVTNTNKDKKIVKGIFNTISNDGL